LALRTHAEPHWVWLGAKYPKQASLKLTGDDFYKKIRQHDERNRAH
jgi:hypothetical protein